MTHKVNEHISEDITQDDTALLLCVPAAQRRNHSDSPTSQLSVRKHTC